jgi:hypothetical protein
MLWDAPQVPDGVYDSELSRFQSLLASLRAAGDVHLAQELEDASPLKQVVSCLHSCLLLEHSHSHILTLMMRHGSGSPY